MERLLRAAASDQDQLAESIRELVEIPTENPPGRAGMACVSLLERACREAGLDCEAVTAPPQAGAEPRVSLVATYGEGEPVLYFHGHYDVVPAFDPEQFAPRVRGRRLFGRGSADMKGGLAAMLDAVRLLEKARVRLTGTLKLVFVPDEETGGTAGSAYLGRVGLLGRAGIGMLTPEPSGGVVWNASRGALSLRVRVRGRAAHVGLQHLGINAFERMQVVVAEFLRIKREVEERRTAYNVAAEEARRSILLIGGRCAGGTNFNTVPEECWFTLDRRPNPEENLAEEKGRLMELVDRLRRDGIPLEVEVLQEGSSVGVSEETPLARALAASVEDVTGRRPRFEMCPGMLEIRFYAERGVPALAYGPGRLSVSHGPSEYVDLRHVVQCSVVYGLTALRLLGHSGEGVVEGI